MDIKHVVVLMLENRSFDCMLGMLYQSGEKFDGLTGTETNTWHKPDGSQESIAVTKAPVLDAKTVCIPDPDPGECFKDIHMQIHGLTADGIPNTSGPTMGGFCRRRVRTCVGKGRDLGMRRNWRVRAASDRNLQSEPLGRPVEGLLDGAGPYGRMYRRFVARLSRNPLQKPASRRRVSRLLYFGSV